MAGGVPRRSGDGPLSHASRASSPRGEAEGASLRSCPRIYEGGGPRSGRGSPPPQPGTALSVTASPCQLPQRGSRGRFAPFLPPAFMRGEGHAVAGGVPRAAGKASSVTASPCQLPQGESQGGCAPITGHSEPVLLSGERIPPYERYSGTISPTRTPDFPTHILWCGSFFPLSAFFHRVGYFQPCL